ncbi:MAG: hypothetical protein QM761_09920 [Pseudoxanthomonas sp.]
MSLTRLGPSLLALCACLSVPMPAWAQSVGMPTQSAPEEFGPTGTHGGGQPQWHGRLHVRLQVVPSCVLGFASDNPTGVYCTRGVRYRSRIVSEATGDPAAPPAIPSPWEAIAPPAPTLTRVSLQRLFVEF